MTRMLPRIMRKNKHRFTQGPYRPYDADRYDTVDGATDSYDTDGMTDGQLTGVTKRLDSIDKNISIINERLLNSAVYNTEEHRRIHASLSSLDKANAKTDASVKELIVEDYPMRTRLNGSSSGILSLVWGGDYLMAKMLVPR